MAAPDDPANAEPRVTASLGAGQCRGARWTVIVLSPDPVPVLISPSRWISRRYTDSASPEVPSSAIRNRLESEVAGRCNPSAGYPTTIASSTTADVPSPPTAGCGPNGPGYSLAQCRTMMSSLTSIRCVTVDIHPDPKWDCTTTFSAGETCLRPVTDSPTTCAAVSTDEGVSR